MLKIVRSVLLALLASLVTGLAIGTWIRIRMEEPERYFIGQTHPIDPSHSIDPSDAGNSSLAARAPWHVGHVRPTILDPGHDEEQVG